MRQNQRVRQMVGVVALVALGGLTAMATEVRLRDGYRIRGSSAFLKSMGGDIMKSSPGDPIILIDNTKTRYYVPRLRIDESIDGRDEPTEAFKIPQPGKAATGAPVRTVGPPLRITNWDEFGRRIYTMSAIPKTVDVIQCITLITPKYVKVEAYDRFEWTQYIATTSIPPEMLHLILLKKGINSKLLRDRLRLVQFYLQMERFSLAERELAKLIDEFPEAKEQYQRTLVGVRQLKARRLLQEIETRAVAGQHRLAYTLLQKFPTKGVAGEILARVREMGRGYDAQLEQLNGVRAQLTKHINELIAQNTQLKEELDAIRKEICGGETLLFTAAADKVTESELNAARIPASLRKAFQDNKKTLPEKATVAVVESGRAWRISAGGAKVIVRKAGKTLNVYQPFFGELSILTLDRMAAYQQLAADPDTTLEQKVALAISGWNQGPAGPTNNLPVALSLYKVRALVHEYFNAELKIDRDEILERLKSQEGATPERLAKMLAHMKPPKDTPPAKNGFYQLTVDGPRGGKIGYYVQLPPNYDPYRRYPAIVTLHGAGTSPPMQIDWWAGGVGDDGSRQGHGSRHGYIIIAPAWGVAHQVQYQFSLREHIAVLNSLRDACRRFAVDTDRVFLSGHSMGGGAAWDIGLAHPDLFAGVIPIGAKCEKYCDLYWKNAKYMPIYYVCGEMDGNKLATSIMSLDRYMKATFPVIVAEYVGRGHEDFSDEVLNLFDWMARQRRNFAFRDFSCVTKRPWDNFFWWVEMEGLPDRTIVLPEDIDKKGKGPPFTMEGKVGALNSVRVSGRADKVTVWLTPELVDFNKPVRITVNGSTKRLVGAALRPSVDVILEDVRTRGDRLHPFWAKYEVGGAARIGRR